ncbi:gamma-interferon-inducible lysosomal thiol reductase [Ceratina calcarata]|uniref:Gamma-interferon-inducible lysosomal thiol reductase n=1 Tax=Ceratina calcarata TaxID=156304 RepID=A0AAJ7S8J8_9HYME|nr:gamma-interferon-inducible lysosomal thiol reductase [Ceratina calcarata]
MRCYLFTSSCSLAAIIAVVAILGHGVTVAGNETAVINVGVYYESLCGDSMRFIKNQLVPSYDTLKDYISITFVPYGKASHTKDVGSNEWKFSCQHGSAECDGNMAQACGIHAIQNEEQAEKVQQLTVALVGCAMASRYPPSSVPGCANDVGLSEKTRKSIDSCIAGSLSKELLVANGEKTKELDPKLSFVPTITINGVTSSEIQSQALTNFLKLICDTLPKESKPSRCSNA